MKEEPKKQSAGKAIVGVVLILLPTIIAGATGAMAGLGYVTQAAQWASIWAAVFVFVSPLIGIYMLWNAVFPNKKIEVCK